MTFSFRLPRMLGAALLVAGFVLTGACSPGPAVTAATPEAPERQPVTVRPNATPPAARPATVLVEPLTVDPDTVTFSRWDTGRMWTFDNPPTEYLQQAYGFTADADWYERARLGALRFAEYCSASFVSPDGLILTNHHCARESITAVTAEGEDLDATGFIAATRGEERHVDGLVVEQLIDLFDVTERIEAAVAGRQTTAERISARNEAIQRLETQFAAERGGEAAGIRAQIVEFYSGGAYSAYIYQRYEDVRLVFAPEAAVGFFGGDPDNFTYPRYTLDYTFFRAYDRTGQVVNTSDFYFPWSASGSEEGDLVFVVGNPGSTSRLQTVAGLEYRRDVREPAILNLVSTRADIYQRFIRENPDHPATPELRDTFFSLSNARKAYSGQLAGLEDDYIIARRLAAERALQTAIEEDPVLAERYGGTIAAIAANRRQAAAQEPHLRAFLGINPGSATASNILGRAMFAYGFGLTGNPGLRETALSVEEDRPDELELALLTIKLQEIADIYSADDPVVRQILRGRTPEVAAQEIFEGSRLRTHEGTQQLFEAGNPSRSNDPAIVIARALWPRFADFQSRSAGIQANLGELSADLARARFAVFGMDIPPDATFTLRLNDGVVAGYPYNGTVAPPYTTFWGMYDRHFSHAGTELEEYFELPERWLPVPDALDLTTPYNFVTTNDIIGGNSGSPMLNRNLEIVGVAFDGNIESLPGDFIYLPELNRTVGVDSRAMIHVLETVYDAAHLARELRVGARVPAN